MLRDNLAGLIEPMFDSAGAVLKLRSRAVVTNKKGVHRTIDPVCLENPAPKGRKHFQNSLIFFFHSVASLSSSEDADQFLKLTKPGGCSLATHRSI